MTDHLKIIWSIVAFSLVNIATGFYWFGSINSEVSNLDKRVARIEDKLDK